MLVTTEAIILRSRKQGDTSKIVSVYTRDYGLVDLIAKGAREMKSKFGSSLEPFNCAKVTFYKKEGKDLYLLSSAESAITLRNLQSDLEHIEAATKVVELLLRSQHHEESNVELYEHVKRTLALMSEAKEAASVVPILYAYYLRYIHLAGFAMRFENDSALGGGDLYFDIESGEVIHLENSSGFHSERIHKITPEVLAVLKHIERNGITGASSLRVSEVARHILDGLFRSYLAMHIEGMQHNRTKSSKVFSAMGK
ncbi:MAG: DNA repair protein RecO [Bacteroidota bacterium]|nr:DNA repair protein RecO [Bacteroidota bacterium]MDP4229208.1 DNA repair protein RecO [Bacteroidota bacterium]MDP4235262.1 DNA repair protein RecO [Bacteroidota bacterium]